jgi:tetratricopeptide (TPR) repeat protein
VYESLPVAQRHALHAATAHALERLYAGRLEDTDDRLAYHYARTAQSDRAVECLSRLAQKAARGHAHTEALGALEEALAHVERLPAEARDQRRLRLVLRKASSLIQLGRFREVLSVLLHWKASVDRLDDVALSAYYHFPLARTHLFVGDQVRAIHSAERAIADAARCEDTVTLGKAHYVLAQEAPLSGRSADGIKHALEALACLEQAGRPWWVGQAHWVVGLNHAMLGELDAALEAETRARLIGETVGNRQLQASALCATGIVRAGLGDTEAGSEACEASVSVAPDPLTSAVTLGWLGSCSSSTGRPHGPSPPWRRRPSNTASSDSRSSSPGSRRSWPMPIGSMASWSALTPRRARRSRSPGRPAHRTVWGTPCVRWRAPSSPPQRRPTPSPRSRRRS